MAVRVAAVAAVVRVAAPAAIVPIIAIIATVRPVVVPAVVRQEMRCPRYSISLVPLRMFRIANAPLPWIFDWRISK